MSGTIARWLQVRIGFSGVSAGSRARVDAIEREACGRADTPLNPIRERERPRAIAGIEIKNNKT